jgi:Fe2+ or Zn2+ uptake regulation protein
MKFVTVYRNLNQIRELQLILVNFNEVLVQYYTNS